MSKESQFESEIQRVFEEFGKYFEEITDKYVMAIFPLEEDLENIKSAISKAIGVKLEEVKK